MSSETGGSVPPSAGAGTGAGGGAGGDGAGGGGAGGGGDEHPSSVPLHEAPRAYLLEVIVKQNQKLKSVADLKGKLNEMKEMCAKLLEQRNSFKQKAEDQERQLAFQEERAAALEKQVKTEATSCVCVPQCMPRVCSVSRLTANAALQRRCFR
jgi:hypothetical protein